MKVLALSDSLAPWHSFWIRFGQYADALPWPVTISNDPSNIADLQAGDRLLIYRYSCDWGDLTAQLRTAHRQGVVILSDVDDYLWQACGWSRERLRGCTNMLRLCHALSCSTGALMAQLQVMFPTVPMQVLANSAPKHQLQRPPSSPDEPLRIGWTGAPWIRPADLELLRPLAAWIAERPQQLRLVHVGHAEGYLSLAEALALPKQLVETVPLQSHGDYVRSFRFDIGLAPLASNSFNRFKSAIKVIEYSSQAIPWLASDVDPYRELCRQWQWSGRLCQSPSAWINHLIPLLDHNLWSAEAQALHRLCQEHASYGDGVNRWRQLLSWQPANLLNSSAA